MNQTILAHLEHCSNPGCWLVAKLFFQYETLHLLIWAGSYKFGELTNWGKYPYCQIMQTLHIDHFNRLVKIGPNNLYINV